MPASTLNRAVSVFLGAVLVIRQIVHQSLGPLTGVISWVVNLYLTWWHPIRAVDSAKRIPSCAYEWPNGQGTIAKFIEGEANGRKWSKEHGKLYRIWSGTTQEIVLTESEHVQQAFKDSDLHLKATNSNAGWLFGSLLGKCVGLISNTEWREARESLDHSWTHKSTACYVPRIEALVQDHFSQLHSSGRLINNRINPVADLRLLPFFIVADYLYGRLTIQLKAELQDLIPLRESLILRVLQGGVARYAWSRFLPTQANRDLTEFKRRWARFNMLASEHSKLARENTPIVEMHAAVRNGFMTEEHMLQTLDEMLFANLDVTIGGVSWNLIFLATDLDVQAQLRCEIGRMRVDARTWSEYLLSSKSLLSASILEAARLKPVAPFTIPQAAPTNRVIGGYLIPAKTNLIVDTYAINVRNPFWGEDRASYRPSRFLERKQTDLRYQYWRFGFGPRQCLGKYLAEIITRSIAAYLISNYTLGHLEGNGWDRQMPESWITHPDTEIRCAPVKQV